MGDKPTPTPWEIHEATHADGEYWASIGHGGMGPITDIVGAEGNPTRFFQPVAGMKYLVTPVDEQRANAALIVRAVNCHEDLVEALKFYASEGTWQCDTAPDPGFSAIPGSALSDFDHGEKARAVLAKVEAKDA